MKNFIENLVAAQEIIMQARVSVRYVLPVHDKLCRIGDYLNQQAQDVLKELEAA